MTAYRSFRRYAATVVLAVAVMAGAPLAVKAAPLYDNLGASTDFTDPINLGPAAQSFNSGTFAVDLHDVQLLLYNGSDSFSGTLTVELLSDNSNAPGSPITTIGSLAYSAIATGFATYNVTLPTDFLLTANTNYWIDLVSSGDNAIEWASSLDTSGPGVAGTYASNPADAGIVSPTGLFPVNGNGAYQMQVDVPEPTALSVFATALLLLGLVLHRRARG